MNPQETNGYRETSRHQGELSLLALANFALRQRALLILVPLFLFAATVGYNLLQDRTYTSVASFVPQSRGPEPGNLAGIAAQFGVSIGGSEPAHSPAFYAELVRSRTILGPLADTSFVAVPGEPPVTLAGVYGIETTEPLRRREQVIEELRGDVWARTSRETGVVTMFIRAATPLLAHGIALHIFELLNEFNVTTRQSQARAERAFVESLLRSAEAELLTAERAQQQFLQANRQWDRSPELLFQHERLAREVHSRQQLLDALRQRYEQARIDEVRDAPLITMLETPSIPLQGDARGTVGRGVLALFIGGLLGLALAFARDIAQRGRREGSEEYLQFVRLRNEAVATLTSPLRRGGRRTADRTP
jgi:ribosomal protein L17